MNSLPLERINKLQELLLKRQESLSLAESCTGGLLAYWLTHLPGASGYFKGSVVSYTEDVKQEVLGLSLKFIQEKGVVNKEAAQYMAQGVRNLLKTTWSLSITGIAGPSSGTFGESVGQVAFCVSSSFATESYLKHIEGKNRQEIRHQSAFFALDLLISKVKYQDEVK